MGSLKYREIFTVLLIIAVAAVFRVFDLAGFDIWFDEATAALETRSFLEIPSLFSSWGNLVDDRDYLFLYHHLFLHYWKMFFGDSVYILRLSSVLFGLLSLLAAYLMVKVRFGKRNAFMSLTFLTLSPMHIYYSRELKSYAALMLFGFMFYYFIFSYFDKKKKSSLIGFIISGVLAVYCHYIFLFFVAGQFIYMAFSAKEKISFKQLVGLGIVYLVLLFPLLLTLAANTVMFSAKHSNLNPLTEFPVWFGAVSFMAPFYTFKNFIIGYFYDFHSFLSILNVLVYAVIFVYAFVKEENKFFICSVFGVPFLVFVFSSFAFNVYIDRYFLVVLPFLILFLIKGIFYLRKSLMVVCFALLLLSQVLGVIALYGGYLNADMDEHVAVIGKTRGLDNLTKYLNNNFRDGDIILNVSKLTVLPLKYYSRQADLNKKLQDEIEQGRVLWFDKTNQNFSLLMYQKDRPIISFKTKFEDRGKNNSRVWLIAGAFDNNMHPTRKIAAVLGDEPELTVIDDISLYLYS